MNVHRAIRNQNLVQRRGVAAVEFAICLPVLLAIVFGAVEISQAILVKQALTSAAYEAGNVVSADGGTSVTAQSRANTVLAGFRIKSPTIKVTPTVDASTAAGTQVTITCSAPLGSNSITTWTFSNRVISTTYVVSHM